MPSKKLVIPSFQNEGDEASWWAKNRAAVETELRGSMRAGRTIPLATARQVADRKGAGYQTYINFCCMRRCGKKPGGSCESRSNRA